MATENTARAFWVREPGTGVIRTSILSPPRPGELQLRTLFSGVSRGTESLVFRGAVPQSQYEAMRGPFQEGDFPGPVKYGYMSVAQVESAGGDEGRELIGRTVFCLYPHQDRYLVPLSAVTPVPEGLPAERAILAANMETAVNGVWDGRPGVGDRILVVGGGVVGLLVAWLCRRIPGVDLTLVDPNTARSTVAEALGIRWAPTVPEAAPADLVFHASGNPAGLQDGLASAGDEATVVELSWFGDQSVALPLGEGFHPRRLTLRSSQVGRIPPYQQARWSYRRRMALALELLEDPALEALVTGESDFEELPEVMPRLAGDAAASTLCHRVRYPG